MIQMCRHWHWVYLLGLTFHNAPNNTTRRSSTSWFPISFFTIQFPICSDNCYTNSFLATYHYLKLRKHYFKTFLNIILEKK